MGRHLFFRIVSEGMGNDLYDWELVAVCLDKGNIADSRLFLENQGKMSGAGF
jgi:hypothetical protein